MSRLFKSPILENKRNVINNKLLCFYISLFHLKFKKVKIAEMYSYHYVPTYNLQKDSMCSDVIYVFWILWTQHVFDHLLENPIQQVSEYRLGVSIQIWIKVKSEAMNEGLGKCVS